LNYAKGSKPSVDLHSDSYYVHSALIEMPGQIGPALKETSALILYVTKFAEFDEAIAAHKAVSVGLSSSHLRLDLRKAERFVSSQGSDCGIASVNIGTSGAEIGGAFDVE
jgi:aldehyde dehydrogenase (NAD+)